ncbi:MAG: NAD(P)H-dependent oxidoreductase [Endomicrobia bacterium]|nr:NAD(P)H-dependent oxidoreductase [Endomicrobiia bacterium]
MEKAFLRFFSAVILCAALAVSIQTAAAQAKTENKADKKVLIVYYSWSGNTAELAKIIQKETGGDIFEIQTEKPYPKEYKAVTEQAKKEINDGYKPAIKGKINNIAEYDVIFVGSPNWWGTIAPAVTTFLSEYDLSGKIVAPFFTHGGGGMQNCAADTAKLLPKSAVVQAVTFSGYRVKDSQEDIKAWVKEVLK